MKFEFDDEGGYVDLAVGPSATTTLTIFQESTQVRVAIDSRSGAGEVGLGVGLDSNQARRAGEYLLALATMIEEEGSSDKD